MEAKNECYSDPSYVSSSTRRTSTLRTLLVVAVVVFLLGLIYANAYYGHFRASYALLVPVKEDAFKRVSVDEDADLFEHLLSLLTKRLEELKINKGHLRNATCTGGKDQNGPCFNNTCPMTFAPPRERLRTMLETQYSIEARHRDLIEHLADQSKDTDIIFITGASANHYRESQVLLRDLVEKVFPFLRNHTRYSFQLVYYDLGLKEQQAKVLRKYCDCFVVPFPFAALPETFSLLYTCSWKPVMIKAHLRHGKMVIWMDASTRFKDGNITSILQHIENYWVYISRTSWMLPGHVALPMLDYFKIEACLLSPFYELAGGFLAFKNDELVELAVVNPWLACAFSPNCLCPGPKCVLARGDCHNKTKFYSRCHRFDQSAIAVVLTTLFGYQATSFVGRDFGRMAHFDRVGKMDFFPEVVD